MTIPKEPRQQMINLMYLFLTAMLALNVSAEILNAFTLVNEGLDRSVASIQDKNAQLISALKEKKEDDPEAEDEYFAALQVEQITQDAITEIDSMISHIFQVVGRKEEHPDQLVNPGNLEVSTNYMVNDKRAEQLKYLIQNTKDSFASVLEGNTAIINNLPLDVQQPPSTEGEQKSWEEYNFYGIPAVATITLLTKFKNDFRNAESTVLEYLSSRVNADKFTFDALTGRAISNRNILNKGETYKADIFVSATSNASQPTVYLGPLSQAAYDEEGNLKRDGVEGLESPPLTSINQTIEESENGIVTYEVNASSPGVRSYSGVIEIINPNNGKVTYYPFKEEYTVSESMAVVSAEKMNVFYVGVDNPVSVSAPGYQHSQIRPVLRGPGSISSRGTPGKYTVKITDNKDIVIDVFARPEGEAERKIGSVNFRGKNIPTPDVYMGNSTGPAIKASQLRAQTGIYALAEGFDFEVKFNIRSFELTYKKTRQQNLIIEENKGPIFNQSILSIIRNAGPGDRIWLDDIKIAMPDGTTRTESMSLKVF